MALFASVYYYWEKGSIKYGGKGGSNETLDNLEQECGTYFQFFLRPPLTVRY